MTEDAQLPSHSQGLNFRIGRQRPYFAATTRYFDTSAAGVSGPTQIYSSSIDRDLPFRSLYPLGVVFPDHIGSAYRIDFRVCFDFLGKCVLEVPMSNAKVGTMESGAMAVSLDYTNIVGQVWVASGSANQPQIRVTHSSGNGASTACFSISVTADTVRYVVDYQLAGPSYLRGLLLISEEN